MIIFFMTAYFYMNGRNNFSPALLILQVLYNKYKNLIAFDGYLDWII